MLSFSWQRLNAFMLCQQAGRILERCIDLFMKDYEISVLYILIYFNTLFVETSVTDT